MNAITAQPEAATAPAFDDEARADLVAALDAAGIKPTRAAQMVGINVGNFNQAVKGKRGLSPETCGAVAALVPGTPFAERFAAFVQEAPATGGSAGPDAAAIYIDLDHIDPNPDNPRKTFDPDEMKVLVESIATMGLLQPVVVSPNGAGRYRISGGGDRRRRALLELKAKGRWPEAYLPRFKVPAVVREATREELIAAAIVENLMRADVPRLEEAEGFVQLADLGWSSVKIAANIGGISKSYVQQAIKLVRNLPDDAKEAFRKDEITFDQARFITDVPAALRPRALETVNRFPSWSVPHLRNRLRDALPDESDAMFETKAYTERGGEMWGKGKDKCFAEVALFNELQKEALAETRQTLGNKWSRVDEVRGYFYRGAYSRTKDASKGFAVIEFGYSTSDEWQQGWQVHEGFCEKKSGQSGGTASGGTKAPKRAIPAANVVSAQKAKTAALQDALFTECGGSAEALRPLLAGIVAGLLSRYDDTFAMVRGNVRHVDEPEDTEAKAFLTKRLGELGVSDESVYGLSVDPENAGELYTKLLAAKDLPAIFAAMVAQAFGTWAGHSELSGDTPLAMAIAHAVRAEVTPSTVVDAEWLKRLNAQRLKGYCRDAGVLEMKERPKKKGDLIEWFLGHHDRHETYAPPELRFDTREAIEQDVQEQTERGHD